MNLKPFYAKLLSLPSYRTVCSVFEAQEAARGYIAGGALRNYLLYGADCEFKDIDVFFEGRVSVEFIKKLGEYGTVDSTPFGSIRWVPTDSTVNSYDIVGVSDMAVLDVKPQTIMEALNQFDLTINGVACALLGQGQADITSENKALVDIKNKIARIIRFDFSDEFISPICRISPMSTLWFRTLHYAAKHSLSFEMKTMSWLREHRWRIKYLSEFKHFFFTPDLTMIPHV